MKITKRKLQRIIKEEMQAVLSEMPVPTLGVLAGSYTVQGFSQNIFLQSLQNLAAKLEALADRIGLKPDAKTSLELEHGDITLAGAPGTAGDYDSEDISNDEDVEYPATIAKVKKIAQLNIRALERALAQGYDPNKHAQFLSSYKEAGQEYEQYPVKIKRSEIRYSAGGEDLSKPDDPANSGYMFFQSRPIAFPKPIHPAKLAAVLKAFVAATSRGISVSPAVSPDLGYRKGSVLNKFKVGGDEDGVQGRMRAQRMFQEPE